MALAFRTMTLCRVQHVAAQQWFGCSSVVRAFVRGSASPVGRRYTPNHIPLANGFYIGNSRGYINRSLFSLLELVFRVSMQTWHMAPWAGQELQ